MIDYFPHISINIATYCIIFVGDVTDGLSRISNWRRVAYLALVTLISYGKRCGTDISNSELA